MSDFADAIVRDLMARTGPVVRQLADDCRDDVRRACSVPVGRAGGRVIRSQPGEPPRRETGGYVGEIQSEASALGDTIHASAFTDSMLGLWLEKGTSRMAARPHWSAAAVKWSDEARQRIEQALSGPSPA